MINAGGGWEYSVLREILNTKILFFLDKEP